MTALKVPAALPPPSPKTTLSPPLVSWFPLASRATNVMVVAPPSGMLAGASEIVDCPTLNVVGVTVMVGAADVTLCALTLAWMVLLPAAAPMKLAVYVPLPLSLTMLKLPLAVPPPSPKPTVSPPEVS